MPREKESSLVKETLNISKGVTVFAGLAIAMAINDAYESIKHQIYHLRKVPHKKIDKDIFVYYKRA